MRDEVEYAWQASAQANEEAERAPDPVDHPPHYTAHPSGVECIEISEALSFCLGNALKYIWRAGQKEGVSREQDIRKAIWYLRREAARCGVGTIDLVNRERVVRRVLEYEDSESLLHVFLVTILYAICNDTHWTYIADRFEASLANHSA